MDEAIFTGYERPEAGSSATSFQRIPCGAAYRVRSHTDPNVIECPQRIGRLRLDSTQIIVRRGAAQTGQRVRAALGIGRVEIQLDSARLLDVSVLLGADFAAASRARLDFHP